MQAKPIMFASRYSYSSLFNLHQKCDPLPSQVFRTPSGRCTDHDICYKPGFVICFLNVTALAVLGGERSFAAAATFGQIATKVDIEARKRSGEKVNPFNLSVFRSTMP